MDKKTIFILYAVENNGRILLGYYKHTPPPLRAASEDDIAYRLIRK